jgi:hypothetical protein
LIPGASRVTRSGGPESKHERAVRVNAANAATKPDKVWAAERFATDLRMG